MLHTEVHTLISCLFIVGEMMCSKICATHRDMFFSVPGMPSDIKAIAAGSDRVLVSWKPPLHANGIITKYTVYVRDITSGQVKDS